MNARGWTKLSFVVLPLAGILAFAADGRARPPNALEIVAGFSSKEACSCAFVVEQTDEYCEAFGKLADYPLTVTIDRKAKTVTSTIATVTRVSTFDADTGCTTDSLP